MSFSQNETVEKVTAMFLLPYILIPQKLQSLPPRGLLPYGSTFGLFLSNLRFMLRRKNESRSLSYGVTLES